MPFVTVGEVELRYELRGSGPLLALVMGLGVDGRAWAAHVDELAGEFTCLTFDHRGCGETRAADGTPVRPPYSIPQLAADLAGLLRHLELGPAHVCGVSMGGVVSLALALDAPEAVRTLALVSTWQRADELLRRNLELRRTLLTELGPAALQQLVSLFAWTEAAFEQAGESLVGDYRQLVGAEQGWSEEERERYLGQLQAIVEYDCEARLAAIRAPTLVAVGDEDVLTPLRFARVLAERIPGARLEVVPATGHAFCFEHRDRFLALLREWLRTHGA